MADKSRQTIWQAAALECLDHAVRRDAERGGAGTRTSSEVAEYVGITTDQARGVLYALESDDLVIVFGASPLEWRISDKGRAALSRAEGRA